MMASAILSDTIPCERLCISDNDDEDELDSEPMATSVIPHPENESVNQASFSSFSSFQPVLVSAT
jgi:hypothetical protein